MSFKRLKQLEPDPELGVQPVSDSEDDLSSPECLLSLQPVGDDYSSDDETRKKEKKQENENSRKDDCSRSHHHDHNSMVTSSPLTQAIVSNSIRPSYVTHEPSFDFTQAENPTLSECVEELLDFALEENHERSTLINGKKLYDGKTSDEIIQFWFQCRPKMKWLCENFSHDIGTGPIVPGDIIKSIKDSGEKKEWESVEDVINLDIQSQGLQFVQDFLELLQTLDKYDHKSSESSSKDDLHDVFKHVVPLIANFLDISNKVNGQCKLKMHISEVSAVQEGKFRHCEKDHLVIAKPDLVLKTDDEALMFPVEVFAPIASPNKKGAGVFGNLDISQIDRGSEIFRTQHIVQHIGLLLNKMARLTATNKSVDIDNPHISVGMFLARGIIHFSKVNTTVRHVSSFTKHLFASLPSFSSFSSKAYFEGWPWNSEKFRQEMLKLMQDNVKEEGLLFSKSLWHIDLYKSIHRNALFIFLLHYFTGYIFFVQNCPKSKA